ncbi:uncharacterized protein LOC106758379 [Vigna radiata var. radiata]|uniref:Uncharacterized protein LOC106758379 n=1 Tax=Vigna radiata var. radiata TaxID=3916 RepID=A0A1S3TST8_VIGRR|nr:uncharacterized protein LOC106758379 [Vigna radiata var. radiata]
MAPWAIPPCPYPSNSWTRPIMGQQQRQQPCQQPDVLGPRPPQAYTAAPPSTDIVAAMHTLGIHPPYENWYMDTGATSHMTSAQGTLSSYVNTSNTHGLIVCNGHSIPIHGYGHTKLSSPYPPLSLNNVLHAPQLVKNLVSVRKFTTDNFVFVEFDPFGFSVKDFLTGRPVMTCESQGELYPITNPTLSSTFAVVAPSLWHDRLGHPGTPILNSLRKNKLINCTPIKNFCIFHSCPLGKHVKLSFYASNSCTVMAFDIIHSDLWTSPVLSSSGHRY